MQEDNTNSEQTETNRNKCFTKQKYGRVLWKIKQLLLFWARHLQFNSLILFRVKVNPRTGVAYKSLIIVEIPVICGELNQIPWLNRDQPIYGDDHKICGEPISIHWMFPFWSYLHDNITAKSLIYFWHVTNF